MTVPTIAHVTNGHILSNNPCLTIRVIHQTDTASHADIYISRCGPSRHIAELHYYVNFLRIISSRYLILEDHFCQEHYYADPNYPETAITNITKLFNDAQIRTRYN